MISGAAWTRWNLENYNPPIRMRNFFDIDSKSKCLEKLLGLADYVQASFCPDYLSGWLISNTEDQESAALIRNCDAILAEFFIVILLLGFLEFKALMFGRRLSPDIYLVGCDRHSTRF